MIFDGTLWWIHTKKQISFHEKFKKSSFCKNVLPKAVDKYI